MAKGISLHIGLNYVDPQYYNGKNGLLGACENDAKAMAAIAVQMGYQEITLLLNEEATQYRLIQHITQISDMVDPGDIFLLSFSGHGSRIKDLNGDERDGFDEGWCLFDGFFNDDDIYKFWLLFKAGVRILVIADHCYSGTVIRGEELVHIFDPPVLQNQPISRGGNPINRGDNPNDDNTTNRHNTVTYERFDKKHYDPATNEVKATVKLIAATQSDQEAYEKNGLGRFTHKLLKVWNNGQFQGDYLCFYHEIITDITRQIPRYSELGPRLEYYDKSLPFKI